MMPQRRSAPTPKGGGATSPAGQPVESEEKEGATTALILPGARDDVLEQVLNGEWFKVATAVAADLAASGAHFSVTDLRRRVPEPAHVAHWGTVFANLANAGVIRSVGWTVHPRRARMIAVRVWIGGDRA